MRKRNEKDLGERKEISLPLQPVDIPWLVRKPPWRRGVVLVVLPPLDASFSSSSSSSWFLGSAPLLRRSGRRADGHGRPSAGSGEGDAMLGILGRRGEGGNNTKEAGLRKWRNGVRKWKESAVKEKMRMAAIFARDTLHG